MEAQPRTLAIYTTPDGKVPFTDWFHALRDLAAQAKITARLTRVEQGNLGDYRAVGEGVLELKINFGPGYRISFGQDGKTIVLLLCGGDKSTQDRDIENAKQYWMEYRSNING